ncbi:unnamed protein product [Tilletia caries]|nr:unnamed protein product [Tilletia caries]
MEESTLIPISTSVQLEARIYNPSVSLPHSPVPKGLAIVAHLTFNSRGVGRSTGRASWTGASESEDYQHVLSWSMRDFEARHSSVRGASVVLCGYSAGSLYCSTAQVKASSPTWASQPPLYVLISYPCGVLWALSLFQSARYERALSQLLAGKEAKVLVVYGTKDDFTGRKTYESWIEGMGSSELRVEVIEDGDHFWRTRASLQQLVDCVDAWVSSESD